MSAVVATSVLFIVFFLLLALPLTPACLELIRKTDHAPLKVVQEHAGDVRFFADGFRHYLARIQADLDECELRGSDALIVMPDGVPCLVLAQRDAPHDFGINGDGTCLKVIASTKTLHLPPDTNFQQDIYAMQHVRGGARDQYRALLGDSGVHLAENSVVMRWVHAVGEIECEQGCRLYGRMSSERSIRLHAECLFTRLNAPRIEAGSPTTNEALTVPADSIRSTAAEVMERVLFDGDFQVEPGEVFEKHLVVRGELRIGRGARMLGNVKALKTAVLEPGVITHGSLISSTALKIGHGCRLQGPVIAEHSIAIGTGTWVGTAEAPTTVSAPTIEIAEGAVAFGTLWAREQGQVVGRA